MATDQVIVLTGRGEGRGRNGWFAPRRATVTESTAYQANHAEDQPATIPVVVVNVESSRPCWPGPIFLGLLPAEAKALGEALVKVSEEVEHA